MLTFSPKRMIEVCDAKALDLTKLIVNMYLAFFVTFGCIIFAEALSSMPYSLEITIMAGLFLSIACIATYNWCLESARDLERWHFHLRKGKFRTINIFLCSVFIGYILLFIAGYTLTAKIYGYNIKYLMLFFILGVTYPMAFLKFRITARHFIRLNRVLLSKKQ